MKKRFVLLILFLAALIAALGLSVRGSRLKTVDAQRLSPVPERDFVTASLAYDPGTRTLRGTQAMTLTNRTGQNLSEIVLRLDMNGEDENAVAVSNVQIGGESADFAPDADDPTLLRIERDWISGERLELSFTLMIRHPKADGAALVTLPSPAVWQDGAWQTDAYDALAGVGFAQAFDYTLDLNAQSGAKAAFGGAVLSARAETGLEDTLYLAQMSGARDVSFALTTDGALRQREACGVLVSAIAQSGSAANGLISRAQEALGSLEEIGIAYPFPSLSVVQTHTGKEDGEIGSGLVALSADEDKETIRRKLTRLIARQTFGVLVGNDSYNEPWLSHSLASAAELLAYRERKGEGAYQTRFFEEIEIAARVTRPYGVTVGAGVSAFGGDWEMTQVLRDQGAAMLLGIEQAVGEEAFLKALTLYVERSAGKIASRAELESALSEATGSDWSGYLTDELSF